MIKNILWVSTTKHKISLDERCFLVDPNQEDEYPLEFGSFFTKESPDRAFDTAVGFPFTDTVFNSSGQLLYRVIAGDQPFFVTFWDSDHDNGIGLEWTGEKWVKHSNITTEVDHLETLPYLDGHNITNSYLSNLLNLELGISPSNRFEIELIHRDEVKDLLPSDLQGLVRYFNSSTFETFVNLEDFTEVDMLLYATDTKYESLVILFDDENTSEKVVKELLDLDSSEIKTVLSPTGDDEDMEKSAKTIFLDKPEISICIVVSMEDPNHQRLFINGNVISKEVAELLQED